MNLRQYKTALTPPNAKLTDMSVETTAVTYPELTPGAGRNPRCLAGRKAEQTAWCAPLGLLRRGEGAKVGTLVIGPRGNGQAGLLGWLRKRREQGRTPAGFSNELDELARARPLLALPDAAPALDLEIRSTCWPSARIGAGCGAGAGLRRV